MTRKPISLHTPSDPPPLRMTVICTGSLAAEIRAIAEEYQTPPAAIVRELAVDGLRVRKRLRESM